MGITDSEIKCKRHPNQNQVPGVCSSCLRERLSMLSTAASFQTPYAWSHSTFSRSSSLSSTPPYSSASSSARKSPGPSGGRHRTNGSEVKYVSVGLVLNGGSGLKKSRSVSCAPIARSTRSSSSVSNNNYKGSYVKVKSKMMDDVGEEEREDFSMNITKGVKNSNKGGFFKRLIDSTSKKTKGVLMHSKTVKDRGP